MLQRYMVRIGEADTDNDDDDDDNFDDVMTKNKSYNHCMKIQKKKVNEVKKEKWEE